VKRKWVVRLVLPSAEYEKLGMFLENLRYAGMALVHSPTYKTTGERDPAGTVVDIFLPSPQKEACEAVAERMASFGYNAVAAPSWH
jgi:hypothetical protein